LVGFLIHYRREKLQEEKQEQEISGEQTEDLNSKCECSEECEELKEESCEEKLKKEQEKLLRIHADFENIKRRLEKEKYQAIEFANEFFAKDLLDVVDTLDLALEVEGDSFEKLKEGVELIRSNLIKTFAKHGIEEIKTDCEFDPNFHEAVMQVSSKEHESNHIVHVMKKGFLFKNRVIRPSMVSICKKDEEK